MTTPTDPSKLQYIVWDDSYRHMRDWTPFDDAEKTEGYCVSVGFLHYEDDDCVMIVANIDVRGDEPAFGVMGMQIPKSCIRDWWEVAV